MTEFLKSKCYMTDDFGFLSDAQQRGLICLCLVEPEEASQYPGCSIASLLLPHPIIITEFLNSDPQQMNYGMIINKYLSDYQNYLASENLEQSMVNILASLYKVQTPLLIFCPTDQNKAFKILDSIANFLSMTFGIVPGNYQALFSNDPRLQAKFVDIPEFRYVILDLLFVNGFIDMREYANNLPPNSVPSPRAAAKLLELINQPIADLKSGIITAINIIESIRRETQTGKISPFIETRQAISSEMENQINNMVFHNQKQAQPIPPQQQYIPSTEFLRHQPPPNIVHNSGNIPSQPINNNQVYTPPPNYQNSPYQPMNNNQPVNRPLQGQISVTPPNIPF